MIASKVVVGLFLLPFNVYFSFRIFYRMIELLPISNATKPSIINVKYNLNNEPLVVVNSRRIVFEPQYYLQGVDSAVNKCLLRKTVANKLYLALTYLPDGYSFKVFDAWRPLAVQRALFERYKHELSKKFSVCDEKELDEITRRFVHLPKVVGLDSPPHCTGGAIDLTIVDTNGCELNMGTTFDDFSVKAKTCYYENCGADYEVKHNRRLLYGIMTKAGFTNLPDEWWHFDFGDKYWAYFKQCDAVYSYIDYIQA